MKKILFFAFVTVVTHSQMVSAFTWPGGSAYPPNWGNSIPNTGANVVLNSKVLDAARTQQVVLIARSANLIGWSDDDGGIISLQHDNDTLFGYQDSETATYGGSPIGGGLSYPRSNFYYQLASSSGYVMRINNSVLTQPLDSDCRFARAFSQMVVGCGRKYDSIDSSFKPIQGAFYWTNVTDSVCSKSDGKQVYQTGGFVSFDGITLGYKDSGISVTIECQIHYKTLNLRTEDSIDFGWVYQDNIQTSNKKVVDMSIVFDGSVTTSFPTNVAILSVKNIGDADCGEPVITANSGSGVKLKPGSSYDLSILNDPIQVEWISPGTCDAGEVRARRRFSVQYY